MPIFGAKSRAKRGCASKLACGHRIGPAERTGFTEVSGEFAISQWADRVVGPYKIPVLHVKHTKQAQPAKAVPAPFICRS